MSNTSRGNNSNILYLKLKKTSLENNEEFEEKKSGDFLTVAKEMRLSQKKRVFGERSPTKYVVEQCMFEKCKNCTIL